MERIDQRQIAEALGVSRTTLWRWISCGIFPQPTEKKSNKQKWWSKEVVEEWIKEVRNG